MNLKKVCLCVLADYGVVSMVWLWTGISYSVKNTPPGTIRRLVLPNTWSYHSFWTIAGVRSHPGFLMVSKEGHCHIAVQ